MDEIYSLLINIQEIPIEFIYWYNDWFKFIAVRNGIFKIYVQLLDLFFSHFILILFWLISK